MAKVKWTMDYSPWYRPPNRPMKGGPWTILHGIDRRVWPRKLDHGIDYIWPTESVPWTIG